MNNEGSDQTTSLFDLPPADPNMTSNFDLPEHNVTSNLRRDLDLNVHLAERETEKQQPPKAKKHQPIPATPTSPLRDEHKIIILASLYFMIFGEIKFKSYILKILTVVFGNFVHTINGGMSHVGLFLYGVVYALTLWITVSLVDISSINFVF
jgi:hypothetical protein